MKILVAEDEPAILDSVLYALERDGFEPEGVDDGAAALERARSGEFDLLVLDLMLPQLSGLDVCRTLRAESALPIIMLTARSGEIDRVLGLELGADDYVTKPFSVAELVSRVRALLRRRALDRDEGALAVARVGSLEVDFRRHEVRVDGEAILLTPSEFRLLAKLVSEPGRAFSRRELMQHLWSSEYVGDERAADVHVSNLRAKIEPDAAKPTRIVTVRGVGYKLAAV
jgi:two-component system response regulator RegX3